MSNAKCFIKLSGDSWEEHVSYLNLNRENNKFSFGDKKETRAWKTIFDLDELFDYNKIPYSVYIMWQDGLLDLVEADEVRKGD